jgi:hypothetical protein
VAIRAIRGGNAFLVFATNFTECTNREAGRGTCAKTQGFHQAEALAVHDLSGEFPWVFEKGKKGLDFFAVKHEGRFGVG